MGRLLVLIFVLMIGSEAVQPALAQSANAKAPFYHYEVTWPEPHTRLYHVQLTVPASKGKTTEVAVAAWRPGRYSLQNYAAGISDFHAVDAKGQALTWHKRNKDTWVVQNPTQGPVTVRYQYYANTIHNGASLLTEAFAYFNPVNFLMYVPGQLDQPAELRLPMVKPGWTVVTQLATTQDPQVFTAPDWHDLADAPTVAAPVVRQFTFEVDGMQAVASFVGTGVTATTPTDAAGAHYQQNVANIVRAHKQLFGDIPTPRYDFIYLVGPYGTGATEHSRSAMFVYSTDILANDRAIGNTFSTTSHEFFHLYNIKRIRPASMWPYDYRNESPTSLLWFFEGVTDYYASVLLARAGVLSPMEYLAKLSKDLERLENDPTGRFVSPAMASTNTWLEESGFRDPNQVTSFFGAIYSLGKRAGFLMDLEIRRRTQNQKSLDDVLRYLYTQYYQKDQGVSEDGVLKALNAVTGEDLSAWYTKYIERPGPVDYASVLQPMGLRVTLQPQTTGAGLRALGLDRLTQAGQTDAAVVAAVRPGSDASKAGVGPGMLLLAVNGKPISRLSPDLADAWTPGEAVTLRVQDVIGNVAPRDLTVTYTGNSRPVQATLEEIPGADTGWIRSSWLKPIPEAGK